MRAGLGHRDREAQRRVRRALAAGRRCHDDRARRVVGVEQAQVCPQRAHRVGLARAQPSHRAVAVHAAVVHRNRCQHLVIRADREVARVPDPPIQQPTRDRRHEPEQQPEESPGRKVHRRVRRDRLRRQARWRGHVEPNRGEARRSRSLEAWHVGDELVGERLADALRTGRIAVPHAEADLDLARARVAGYASREIPSRARQTEVLDHLGRDARRLHEAGVGRHARRAQVPSGGDEQLRLGRVAGFGPQRVCDRGDEARERDREDQAPAAAQRRTEIVDVHQPRRPRRMIGTSTSR